MKAMPVKFLGVNTCIWGGRFRDAPKTGFTRVKMAAEINLPCEISIPTHDFSVPDVKVMRDGLREGIRLLFTDKPMYAGCMGGIGRTGLYMALVAKTLHLSANPVLYVRATYCSHAVETDQQKQYIADFDVRQLSLYAYLCAAKYRIRKMLGLKTI